MSIIGTLPSKDELYFFEVLAPSYESPAYLSLLVHEIASLEFTEVGYIGGEENGGRQGKGFD
ncbi:hypothetical protein FRB96_005488 [Tulasnella sp. 330]|nr:hypothetical protein FRB96_005488 [Tulasnella sp. 330]KAG8878483.1 hypothetical protein FRB97_002471 [Tulasnella sp. 331]